MEIAHVWLQYFAQMTVLKFQCISLAPISFLFSIPCVEICCGSIFVPNLILFSFVVGYGDACIIMMLKQKKMEFKPWTNY